jgi:hypothetical protein
MKIRSLIVAALAFLVLGGLLYWSEHRKEDNTSKVSADVPPSILKLDQSAITKLEVKKKGAPPVLLTKAESGNWQITEPKPLAADQSAVSGMLSTLSLLNSERLVEENAADLKRYGLDQPSVEVEISEKTNQSKNLLIGDDTPTGGAVYAMLAGRPHVYTIATFDKNSVDKGLNELRDKRLFTIDADKVSRIELRHGGQDIEFGRDKDEWQILKPKPMRADSSQVSELVQKLADARMEIPSADIGDKLATSSFASGIPLATAKVTDASGTKQIEVRKNKDDYYAKSSMVDGVYKIGADLGHSLDKKLEDFRNKKVFDFGFDDPDQIELHNGDKTYYLMRKGQDWWSNGKKMDSTSVQSLVAKFRELTASKFVESGFSKPIINASVVSRDGKKTEKVSIAKSSDGYLAKLENEPSLYGLDASSVDELLKAAGAVTPASAK